MFSHGKNIYLTSTLESTGSNSYL